MITAREIRGKAAKRYRAFLQVWLNEGTSDSFFPFVIRFRHVATTKDEYGETMEALRELRSASKAETGDGFVVEWKSRRTRDMGLNELPDRIYFESEADYLEAIGETDSFARYRETVTGIREAFPILETWIRSNPKLTIDIAEEGIADQLIAVCRYLQVHPRPGLFARELPIAVDTKFIERHAKKILRPWLDVLLSPDVIRSDETHFERRFGLAYPEPLIRIHFLDSDLQERLGFSMNELALPLESASTAICLDSIDPRPIVYVVENLVTALTLPRQKNALVLAGLGYQANLFRYLKWIHQCEELHYWGDIDSHGFDILSQFRTWFPQTRSFLMDQVTFAGCAEYVVGGAVVKSGKPAHLTKEEAELAAKCRRDKVRLEQEKIPQAWVVRYLDGID